MPQLSIYADIGTHFVYTDESDPMAEAIRLAGLTRGKAMRMRAAKNPDDVRVRPYSADDFFADLLFVDGGCAIGAGGRTTALLEIHREGFEAGLWDD